MSFGLQTYSASGILQFDSNFSQYRLTQIFKMSDRAPDYGSKKIQYSASDSHIFCTYTPSVNDQAPLIYYVPWMFLSSRKLSEGRYEVEVQSVNYYEQDQHRLLIFEPLSLTEPSDHLVGLETYDETGKVVYSTGSDVLKIIHTKAIPPSTYQNGGAFYGTGPETVNRYRMVYDTGIPATDPSNYAVMLSQIREGIKTDYDGDNEIDYIFESYDLQIRNGTLWVGLNAVETGSQEMFWAYWQVGVYNTIGTQIAYVVDVSSYKDRLLAPIP